MTLQKKLIALLQTFVVCGTGLFLFPGCNDSKPQPRVTKRPVSPPPPGFNNFQRMGGPEGSSNGPFGGQLQVAIAPANVNLGSGAESSANYSLIGTRASFPLRRSISGLLTIPWTDADRWNKKAVSLGYEAVEFADGFESYQEISHVDLNLVQRSLFYQTLAFTRLEYQEDAHAALQKAIELGAYDFELLRPFPELIEFAQGNFGENIAANRKTNFDRDIDDAIQIAESVNQTNRIIQMANTLEFENDDALSIVFVATGNLPEVESCYTNLVDAVSQIEFDVPPNCTVIELPNGWFENQQPNNLFALSPVGEVLRSDRYIVQNVLRRDSVIVLIFSTNNRLFGFAAGNHSSDFFSSLISKAQDLIQGDEAEGSKKQNEDGANLEN